jgi:hypothetical protein
MRQGEAAAIVAIDGPQVADTWAFAGDGLEEVLSTEHTRSCLERLSPRVGDALWSSFRRPMLTVVEDTSPGRHDLLLSACDEARYRLLGHRGPHRTCADNMKEALAALGLPLPPRVPSPVNVFENVSIGPDGALAIEPPQVKAGERIVLRAEIDLVLVVSACPMDIVATNGADRRPKPVAVELAPALQWPGRHAATGCGPDTDPKEQSE